MVKYNKESLKAEKSRLNTLLDQENKNCAKCKDRNSMGCEGCFHDGRRKKLARMKEEIAEALANAQG
jgi:hypothetical protein